MFRFTYEVLSHGGIATLRDDEQEQRLVVSDLDDPLENLAVAAVALTRGAPRATAAWVEEPGSFRWVLQRNGSRLLIRVLHFPGTFTTQPDDKGTPVFVTECRLVEFIGQVTSELRRLLEEHGLEGYHALSPHGRGFPLAEYEALQQWSRSRKMAARVQRQRERLAHSSAPEAART